MELKIGVGLFISSIFAKQFGHWFFSYDNLSYEILTDKEKLQRKLKYDEFIWSGKISDDFLKENIVKKETSENNSDLQNETKYPVLGDIDGTIPSN